MTGIPASLSKALKALPTQAEIDRLLGMLDEALDLDITLEGRASIYTGFYERSHGDTIEFRPENLRVCLDYLYEWTCQILVKLADQFSSN